MARLEQIVEQMEADKLPLEEMLERYEEGTKLVQLCSEKLAAAEKKIEIITRNAAGKPQVTEFDPATPVTAKAPKNPKASTASSQKQDASEDVSLF